MSFNDPGYIEEFKNLVSSLNIQTALEIGYGSGELVEALRSIGIEAEGIDRSTELSQGRQAPYFHNTDLDNFAPPNGKKYDLVYSSGVIEHADDESDFLKKCAKFSAKYILTIAPNKNCTSYMNAKKSTPAEWKDEKDYDASELSLLHEFAELRIIQTGLIATEWPKRFGPEPSETYLVYCLAMVPYYTGGLVTEEPIAHVVDEQMVPKSVFDKITESTLEPQPQPKEDIDSSQ